jgi:uncharacterized damage-inducible protein DinB
MKGLADYHRSYAEHNRWGNELIIAAILAMPDDEYYQPIMPKSRTIHQILNHVLVMDRVWLGEVRQVDSGITSGTQIIYETKDDYIAGRRATDAEMTELLQGLTDADLEMMICYDEPQDGFQQWPMMMEVAHIFRHQIHHRGQVSILLQNSSVEMPKLDQLFLPASLKVADPKGAEAAPQVQVA